jgi:hypothetical protein
MELEELDAVFADEGIYGDLRRAPCSLSHYTDIRGIELGPLTATKKTPPLKIYIVKACLMDLLCTRNLDK